MKFVIEVSSDWYCGHVVIESNSLATMTHTFTSMADWYGNICIIEPIKYKSWVYNEHTMCFMTPDEYKEFERKLCEMKEPYYIRNTVWADTPF